MARGHDPREVSEYPAFDILVFDMMLPMIHTKESAFYDPIGGE